MIKEEIIREVQEEAKNQTIVAATKYVGALEIETLVKLGVSDIGENRVSDFLQKYEALKNLDITWHFIGHLQSKKVKKMIDKIDYLHSLDRLSLAEEIQKHRETPLNCFVQVNISNEDSKYGLPKNNVIDFCKKMQDYDKIHIVGLMGMAELTFDDEAIEKQFQSLVDLKDEVNSALNLDLKYLSMGMSNDYRIAIKVGATHLRLGSILF